MKRFLTLLALLCLFAGIMPALAVEKTATFVINKNEHISNGTVTAGSLDSVMLTSQTSDNSKFKIQNGYTVTLQAASGCKITQVVFYYTSNGVSDRTCTVASDGFQPFKTNISSTDYNGGFTCPLGGYSSNKVDFTFNLTKGSLTISEIVVTYENAMTTTIVPDADNTRTTASGTTWDFTNNSSKWTNTCNVLDNFSSEWKHIKSSSQDEYRPVNAPNNTEYDLDLVRGLWFSTRAADGNGDGLCLDYKNGQIWLQAYYGAVTIPGLTEGQYVVIETTGGILTPSSNAEMTEDNVFRITGSGDAKFSAPSGGVYILSISVLDSAPTHLSVFSVSDFDFADQANAKDGIDRTVGGFSFTFTGGDAAKTNHGDTPYAVLRYRASTPGTLTIKPTNANVKITSVKYIFSNSGDAPSTSNVSVSPAATNVVRDGYEYTTSFDGGTDATTFTYAGTNNSDKGLYITGIEITTNRGVTFAPVTPSLTFGDLNIGDGETTPIDMSSTTPQNLYNVSFSSSKKNIASVSYDSKNNDYVITGKSDGTATITATYTPANASLFNAATSTFTVTVSTPLTSQKWIFDNTLSSDGTGIAHGQTFSSDWKQEQDGTYTVYSYNKPIETASDIYANGSVVNHTAGLQFTSTIKDNLQIVPDHSLRLDENGTITIKDVQGGSNILITAMPWGGETAGINPVDNASFINSNLTKAAQKEVFMLKASATGDVIIQPTDRMEIYAIEVNNLQVPAMSATTTLTYKPDKDANYQANNGESFGVTFKMTPTDAKGTLKVYIIGSVVSGTDVSVPVDNNQASATYNATAADGGDAVFVAMFTPDASETKYTYGYSTFIVDVADPTMYRVKNGQSMTPGTVINDVNGITMTYGGWSGSYPVSGKRGDTWGRARREAYIKTFTGYDYTFSANNNAANEEQWEYTNKHYTDANGQTYWYANGAPNNPYMMPAFGGFLKFAPTTNGTLKVYIHQNGAVMQTDHKDKKGNEYETFNPYMIHMRSYYIGDETGKLYTGADGVTARTYAKASDVWNGEQGVGIRNSYGTLTNSTRVDPDDDIDYDTQNDMYQKDFNFFYGKYGDQASDEPQQVYCEDYGWVMLNEGATEYTLHVKAGKTYFFFTNKTKLGFYGFRFTPDANQPTATLSLSDEGSTTYSYSPSTLDDKTLYSVPSNFKKTLHAGMWNSICLPFSLNEEQTKEVFGDGAEIVDLHTIDVRKLVFKKHYYQMIVAGRPYLVFIPEGNRNIGDSFDMPIPSGYVSTSANALSAPINVDDNTNACTWMGTYNKMTLPENALFVAAKPDEDGKTQFKVNESKKSWMNGYHAYLQFKDPTTPAREFSLAFDGVDDDVPTSIDSIAVDEPENQNNSGKVYNLNGQLVGINGLSGLPKGIYIMNGNKYVVK